MNQIKWKSNFKYALYPLNRKLTDYELRKRIGFEDFPGHHTQYRYFKKDNVFIEFGRYRYEYYTRNGAISEFDNITFEKTDFDIPKCNEKIDEIIKRKDWQHMQRKR